MPCRHDAIAFSALVGIDVGLPSGTPVILFPTNGLVLYDPDSIVFLAAIPNDLDSADIMDFILNDVYIGTDSAPPYTKTSMINTAMGSYHLKVKSTQAQGSSLLSTPVSFNIRCIREDINVDGVVTTLDFLLLLGSYGTDCSKGCAADFNDDTVVSTIDFLRLLAVFGYSCL